MQDQQPFDLRGRIAVVTGASGGFGAESARALAGAGARTVLVGRGGARLRQLAEEIGDRALVVQGDVSRAGEADRVVDAVVAGHGSLDILVNAGLLALTKTSADELAVDNILLNAVNANAAETSHGGWVI